MSSETGRKKVMIDMQLYKRLESYKNPIDVNALADSLIAHGLSNPEILDKAIVQAKKRRRKKPRRLF